jgi:hypothetical protein
MMKIIRRMLPFNVDQKVCDKFIETGKVSEHYLRVICFKIIKNQPLNEFEKVIFHGKTKEINELIISITNIEDDE